MEDRIYLTSLTTGMLLVIDSEARVNRLFKKKGQKHWVTKEQWEILQFNEGFNYMLKNGMLYIETPEVAEEYSNIIKCDENYIKESFGKTFEAFEKRIENLSKEMLEEFCQYAVVNKIMDYEKTSVLKKKTGIDIYATIKNMESED